MKPATAADLVIHFGMTARYWTRMAAEGNVPSAWQPSGDGGKWLFDLQVVSRWHQAKLKRVSEWQGHTSAARRTGAAPSVMAGNTGSPSGPQIAKLLKAVCNNG